MSIIIPEVIKREVSYDKDKINYNLHLNKIENNQTYNKIDRSRNDNSTTNITNNNQSKSFIRFIFDIILFPFVLVYRIFKHFMIKFEIKENYNKFKYLKEEQEKRGKVLKKVHKLHKYNDEIF